MVFAFAFLSPPQGLTPIRVKAAKADYGENIQPDISMRLYLFKSLKLKRLNETTRHKSPTLLDESQDLIFICNIS